MRCGFRTPSFKRSLSAATKGAAKRALMREIVPNYGKRGMGWANPKKAAYNHLYSMTTANPIDLAIRAFSILDRHKSKATTEYQFTTQSQECPAKKRKRNLRFIGIEQANKAVGLVKFILKDIHTRSTINDAIKLLNSYASDYNAQARKPKPCNIDFCDTCDKRLSYENRINTHARKMASKIVEAIRRDYSAEDIYKLVIAAKAAENIVFDEISQTAVIQSSSTCNNNTKVSKNLPIWQRVLLVIGLIAGAVGAIFLIVALIDAILPLFIALLFLVGFLLNGK